MEILKEFESFAKEALKTLSPEQQKQMLDKAELIRNLCTKKLQEFAAEIQAKYNKDPQAVLNAMCVLQRGLIGAQWRIMIECEGKTMLEAKQKLQFITQLNFEAVEESL